MYWYLEVLKKYKDFSGRARRKEYWMFVLIDALIRLALSIVDFQLFGTPMDKYGPIIALYSNILFLPTLAVSIRRLHDVGKSGWMLLVLLIPIIGIIWIFILDIMDSEPDENKYGPNPKEFYDSAI